MDNIIIDSTRKRNCIYCICLTWYVNNVRCNIPIWSTAKYGNLSTFDHTISVTLPSAALTIKRSSPSRTILTSLSSNNFSTASRVIVLTSNGQRPKGQQLRWHRYQCQQRSPTGLSCGQSRLGPSINGPWNWRFSLASCTSHAAFSQPGPRTPTKPGHDHAE